jgi:GTP-binding protein
VRTLADRVRNGPGPDIKIPSRLSDNQQTTGQTFEVTRFRSTNDQKVLILKGGRGGLGNEYFKSAHETLHLANQHQASTCENLQIFHVELRMFADIGLVGLPSAGKSTLLKCTDQCKIESCCVSLSQRLIRTLGAFYEFVIADIPGLIEGASDGKGLGTKFLKHITRTRAIAHILSLESEDLVNDYTVIKKELSEHDPELLEKDEVIIFTKSDMIDEKTLKEKLKSVAKITKGKQSFVVSAYDDKSIKELGDGLVKILRK